MTAPGLEPAGLGKPHVGEHHIGRGMLDDLQRLLGGMSGIELVTELRRDRPGTRVLVLSSYGDPGYVRAALEAGAAGYMLKTASAEATATTTVVIALGLIRRLFTPDHRLVYLPAPAG